MGYYAGDFYRGDPGLGAITKFMPGAGLMRRSVAAAKTAARKTGGAPGATTLQAIREMMKGKRPRGRQRLGAMGRHRRMNPLNPRALRRALRRAQGFARFARKTMHFVHPRPHTTRFRFPRRRRK